MRSTMSILGLLNYDRELLDAFQVPEGINLEHVRNLIFAECANLEIRFPNPRIFKLMFLSWNEVKLPVWEELMKTMIYDYNPIHNYDRYEEYDDEENVTGSDRRRRDMTRGETGNQLRSGDSKRGSRSENEEHRNVSVNNTVTNTHNDTTDNQVTGFNGGALVTHDKSIVNGGGSDKTVGTTSDNVNGSGSVNDTADFKENSNYNNNVTDKETAGGTRNENIKKKHRAHLYGNIGVTTSQQMLEDQRIVVQFRVEDVIVRDFRDYFCLDVYLF